MVDDDALARYLDRLAEAGRTATYQEAAGALAIEPPYTIHQLTEALERLMTTDAEAGRPLRAAVVVSKTGGGRPAAGFFAHARALGRYEGPDRGPAARAYHARELAAVRAAAGAVSPGSAGR